MTIGCAALHRDDAAAHRLYTMDGCADDILVLSISARRFSATKSVVALREQPWRIFRSTTHARTYSFPPILYTSIHPYIGIFCACTAAALLPLRSFSDGIYNSTNPAERSTGMLHKMRTRYIPGKTVNAQHLFKGFKVEV